MNYGSGVGELLRNPGIGTDERDQLLEVTANVNDRIARQEEEEENLWRRAENLDESNQFGRVGAARTTRRKCGWKLTMTIVLGVVLTVSMIIVLGLVFAGLI